MKKILPIFLVMLIPTSAFALIGFGFQGGSDLSKLQAESFSEGIVTVNTFEMEANPAGFGGYAFVDLFGFALEGEADFAVGEYKFNFGNQFMTLEPIPFGWARVTSAVTLKKNIMDLSIPFLAKAALNAGGGFGQHISTPRANVGMIKAMFGDDLTNLDVSSEVLEDELITYFEDNMINASGLHLQAGLRFKLLILDTHLNARYNLAKDVYAGKNGYLQMMFKMGLAF